MALMLPAETFAHIFRNQALDHGYHSYVNVDTVTTDVPSAHTDIDLHDNESEFRYSYQGDEDFDDALFDSFDDDIDPIIDDPMVNPTDFASLEHPTQTGEPTTYHQVIINLNPQINNGQDIAISFGLLLRSDSPAADTESDIDTSADIDAAWLKDTTTNPTFFIDSLLCEIRDESDSSTLSPKQRSAQNQSFAYQSQVLTTHYVDSLITTNQHDSLSAYDISSTLFSILPDVG